MKSASDALIYLWVQKRNILTLILDDFTQGYLSSYLGFIWALLSPLVMLAALTLVFRFGFRVSPTGETGTPFIVWLTCGMLPWLYFADGLNLGVRSVTEYAFIIRKAMFRASFLPVIRLFSIGIIHCVMMLFLLFVLSCHAMSPSLYWLQWFYYITLMYLFLLGTTWMSSSLAVFVPDVVSFLGIVTNIGFWATPVFWNATMLPERFSWLLSLNPAYYFVQGYRDTFIERRWFWERPFIENFVFFTLFVFVFLGGAFVFRRLRPHFADAL